MNGLGGGAALIVAVALACEPASPPRTVTAVEAKGTPADIDDDALEAEATALGAEDEGIETE